MGKRDVAWGFFFTSKDSGRRLLVSERTRFQVRYWRRWYYSEKGHEPGPIFRITPPTPKPKKRRNA